MKACHSITLARFLGARVRFVVTFQTRQHPHIFNSLQASMNHSLSDFVKNIYINDAGRPVPVSVLTRFSAAGRHSTRVRFTAKSLLFRIFAGDICARHARYLTSVSYQSQSPKHVRRGPPCNATSCSQITTPPRMIWFQDDASQPCRI